MNIKKIILICSKIVSMTSLMAATEQISTLSLPREPPWGVTISPDTEHQTSSLHSFTVCTFLRPEYSSLSQDIWILHIKEIIMNFCFDFHQFILFFIDILDFRVSNDVYRAISKQAHKTEIHFLELSVTPPNITEILSCPRSLFRN